MKRGRHKLLARFVRLIVVAGLCGVVIGAVYAARSVEKPEYNPHGLLFNIGNAAAGRPWTAYGTNVIVDESRRVVRSPLGRYELRETYNASSSGLKVRDETGWHDVVGETPPELREDLRKELEWIRSVNPTLAEPNTGMAYEAAAEGTLHRVIWDRKAVMRWAADILAAGLLAALLLELAFLVLRRWRGRRRVRLGLCRSCAYPLPESGVCPECGEAGLPAAGP